MPLGIARRTFMQAVAAAFTVALLRPQFALGDGRNILDGGPWLANVEGSSLAEAVSVADAWGRRGLRVLVALGSAAGRDEACWETGLEVLGWQVAHRAHRYRGDALGVAASFLEHPDTRRGRVTLLVLPHDEFQTGGEAAILDGCSAMLAEAVVLRAISPWASHHWVGTLYRRWRRGRPLDLERLHARVERLLGFDPTRLRRHRRSQRSSW